VAAPSAPAPKPYSLWTGRLFLWWARVLQRTVAGRDRHRAHVARRNAAMRAAHARGIDRDTITREIGLSGGQVRKALRGQPTDE
jgi:hypothetical protein